jgi:hypothetical protein
MRRPQPFGFWRGGMRSTAAQGTAQLAQPELETDVAFFENGKLSGNPACG